MFDPAQVPPVADNELLARFVLFSRHIRSRDKTIKPEAFMPHPLVELSVTRHEQATDEELWREGDRVALLRKLTLYGRGDVDAAAFLKRGLLVTAKPIPDNPNHADVTSWPTEKSEQKLKALEIASKSKFVENPNCSESCD